MAVALMRRRRQQREPDDAFDMTDDEFRRHFRLSKETVRWLCGQLAEELEGVRATRLSVEQKVLCALRFFATGSFQGSVGSETTIHMAQSTVSECVKRVAQALVKVGARNGWVRFPTTTEEKAAVKEGFLRLGAIPGVIGCIDGTLISIKAPKGPRKASFMCRKHFYALNVMITCDAAMRILAIDPMRPGSDHDSFVWQTTWLRRRFLAGRIAEPGEYLLGDSGYPLEPWLLIPVSGDPSEHSVEGRFNAEHITMRSIVERCIGMLKARFRCLQRYLTLHHKPERAADIIAACASFHNLCLGEGATEPVDEFEGIEDFFGSSSSSTSSEDSNGSPIQQGLTRNRATRSYYLRGRAVRDGVIARFGTTRAQHYEYLRRVRRRLRRQQHRW
ncbi:putative nuclease HARBI1 [Rhipicephalus sanguineus]|uniref:putative nuclease HARBI1 n=1 Tax=Rhipicephalus sanguineus TaxID=34632 RepID=UPI0018958656|nr:putative nuclease HARBI1 [Rhipicephalus sanguineus]